MEEQIAKAIIGTKQVRLGKVDRESLIQVIRNYIEEKRSIQIVTMWGALKGYGSFGADPLDYEAMLRLKELSDRVDQIYDPGVRINVILEDLTEYVQNPNYTDTGYYDDLNKIINYLVIPVQLIKESELINNIDDHIDLIKRTRIPKEGWPWDHYIERTRSEYPSITYDERIKLVELYFSSALNRKKYVPSGIKLSFCPYPPCVGDNLRKGRVEYKVKLGKDNKRSIPPWCGFMINADRVIGVTELRNLEWQKKVQEYKGLEMEMIVSS